jgi:hypothetical protein
MKMLMCGVAILGLAMTACGHDAKSTSTGVPKASIVPSGSGWSCDEGAGNATEHQCYRGGEAGCKEGVALYAVNTNREITASCAATPVAFCMTYHQNGKDEFTCWNDKPLCGKFVDFMQRKSGVSVTSCADTN